MNKFRDAKSYNYSVIIGGFGQDQFTSSILPTKIPLNDVEQYCENEIRLRYELDLAKQVAEDN